MSVTTMKATDLNTEKDPTRERLVLLPEWMPDDVRGGVTFSINEVSQVVIVKYGDEKREIPLHVARAEGEASEMRSNMMQAVLEMTGLEQVMDKYIGKPLSWWRDVVLDIIDWHEYKTGSKPTAIRFSTPVSKLIWNAKRDFGAPGPASKNLTRIVPSDISFTSFQPNEGDLRYYIKAE